MSRHFFRSCFLVGATLSVCFSWMIERANAVIDAGTPITLASGNSSYWAIALDETYVYWTDVERGLILKVPKNGGDVTQLASTSSNVSVAVAVYGDFVYWAETNASTGFGAIKMVHKNGGTPTTVAADPGWGAFIGIRGLAVDSSGVYWSVAGNNTGSPNGMVLAIPGTPVNDPMQLSSTTPMVLATGLKNPVGLKLHTDNIYWIESDCCGTGGAVKKLNKASGLPVTLASGLGELDGIATDGQNVYFGIWNDSVHKISVTGGTVVELGGYTSSQFLAIDNDFVYFTSIWGDSVGKIAKDGTGEADLANGLVRPWGLAVDETGLYWTEQGAIKKLPSEWWSISPTSTSVNENAGSLNLTVTRADSTSAVTVYVSTVQTEGSSNNNNYVGMIDEPVTFAAGESETTVTVSIIDNGVKELPKTFAFIVQKDLGEAPSIYLAKATFTITDIGAAAWEFTPASATVKNTDGSVTFTLTRPNGAGAKTVYVSTAQTEGSVNTHDYVPLVDQAIAFADGQTASSIKITINNNVIDETDKTFALIAQQTTADPPTTYLAKATFTIVNTSTKAWWISPGASSVHESAGFQQFTVVRSNSQAAQTVYVSTTETQGSKNNNNYQPLLDRPLTFAAGQSYKTVTVKINPNGVVEKNKTFGLIVQQSPTDPQTKYLAKAVFTVINDDGAAIPKLQIVSPYLMPAFKTTPTNLNMAAFLPNQKARAKAEALGIAADDAAEAIVIYETSGNAPVIVQALGAVVTHYSNDFLKWPPDTGSEILSIPSTRFIKANGKSYAVALIRPVEFIPWPLSVKVQQGTKALSPKKFRVVMPPVVLVHGLWGDRLSLKYVGAYLMDLDAYRNSPDIFPIEYSKEVPFDHQGPLSALHSTVTSALQIFDKKRFIGARVDVVAHSMGGLVARVYSSKTYYRSLRDRVQGRIHQIVTLDTPEIGSPVATYLLGHRSYTFNPIIPRWVAHLVWLNLCGRQYPFLTIEACLAEAGKPIGPKDFPFDGAIAALAEGSTNLQSIQPFGPKISGAKWQAVRAQVSGISAFNQLVFALNELIIGAGLPDSVNTIFTKNIEVQPNDGVVSIESQSAGGKPPDHTVTFENLAHSGVSEDFAHFFLGYGFPNENVTNSDAVNALIACWLTNNGDDICGGKLPSVVARKSLSAVPASASASRRLHLDASRRLIVERPKKVTFGSPFRLAVRGWPGVERVVIQQRDERGRKGKAQSPTVSRRGSSSVQVDVQPEFPGKVTFVISAIYTDGAVSQQEMTIPVAIPNDVPARLSGDMNFSEILLGHIGASYQLHPQIVYPNAAHPIALDGHVQYRLLPGSGEPAVKLSADGNIEAIRPGIAAVEVRFGSSVDVIDVIVRPGA